MQYGCLVILYKHDQSDSEQSFNAELKKLENKLLNITEFKEEKILLEMILGMIKY